MYGGAFMPPSMGGETWLGPEMPSAMFWQQPATQQHQVATNQFGARGRTAALAALQKFAAADEVRAKFDHPPVGVKKAAPMSPEEYERRRRMAAEVQAEATMATLLADGITVNPVQKANVNIPDETDRSGAADSPDETATSLPPGALNSQGARYTGRIKNFNRDNGFGFIQSDAITKLYGCDVFLNHAVEGGITVGGQVSFTVELNQSGKPQARDVKLEIEEAPNHIDPSVSEMVGETFNGRIKSFNSGRGLGFISCYDLQRVFGGRDIYLSKTQAPEGRIAVGQEVEFSLWIDRKGQPQARNVRFVKQGSMLLPRENPISLSATDGFPSWRLFTA